MTTREYAQTIELLELYGIPHEVVGPAHGGARAAGKARAMTRRLRALRRYARDRNFGVALSHASHELPMVARSLGIPSSYAFDYEFARTQHGLGCRAARRVVVPEAIPQDRLDRLGASERKVRRYPGLKEEYALHGFVAASERPGRARPRSRPRPRRRAHTSGRFALPPPREPAVRRGARAPREPTRRCKQSSCLGRRSSATRSERRIARRSSCRSRRSTR